MAIWEPPSAAVTSQADVGAQRVVGRDHGSERGAGAGQDGRYGTQAA